MQECETCRYEVFFYKRSDKRKSSDYKTIAWKNEVSSKVSLEDATAQY
jgi:hypothetical protein